MKYDPAKDGIDHLNVYSQGKTELGRFLSNFAHTPFNLPEDGHFESVEGYWYWLLTGEERLRRDFGYQAKKRGREVLAKLGAPKINKDGVRFKLLIQLALVAKMMANPTMWAKLRENKLPLAHYYVHSQTGAYIHAGYEWILDILYELAGTLPADWMPDPTPGLDS